MFLRIFYSGIISIEGGVLCRPDSSANRQHLLKVYKEYMYKETVINSTFYICLSRNPLFW